jgi:hypothetical protein
METFQMYKENSSMFCVLLRNWRTAEKYSEWNCKTTSVNLKNVSFLFAYIHLQDCQIIKDTDMLLVSQQHLK